MSAYTFCMLYMFLNVTPTTKERPRFAKNGHAFTPIKTKKAEYDIKVLVKAEMKRAGLSITKDPVSIFIRFHYEVPKKMTKEEKELLAAGTLFRCRSPDVDNMAKLLMDALNGVLYVDDCQVIKLVAEKKITGKSGVEFKVEKM